MKQMTMQNNMIKIADHGYVKFIEDWGYGEAGQAEAGIVEAARQSTQGSFRGWEKDLKLLQTLYTSDPKHATPFEFAGLVIEVQAPIMVFREWHRHRTQSYNEMSARYAPLPDLYYIPDGEDLIERAIAARESSNKQAQALNAKGAPVEQGDLLDWLDDLKNVYQHAENVYKRGLSIGVPKELARLPMPAGHYTRMRASANLRNWLAFLTLRMDPMAQREIQWFAHAVGHIVKSSFPNVWSMFELEINARKWPMIPLEVLS